jgi:hypothetical protein
MKVSEILKTIVRKYYEPLYTYKSDSLNETNFLKTTA